MRIDISKLEVRTNISDGNETFSIMLWESVPDKAEIRLYIEGKTISITKKKLKAFLKTNEDLIS